jgi:hypothetical protein
VGKRSLRISWNNFGTFFNDRAGAEAIDHSHAKRERQTLRSAFLVEQIPILRCYRSAAAMLHTPLWAFPP